MCVFCVCVLALYKKKEKKEQKCLSKPLRSLHPPSLPRLVLPHSQISVTSVWLCSSKTAKDLFSGVCTMHMHDILYVQFQPWSSLCYFNLHILSLTVMVRYTKACALCSYGIEITAMQALQPQCYVENIEAQNN